MSRLDAVCFVMIDLHPAAQRAIDWSPRSTTISSASRLRVLTRAVGDLIDHIGVFAVRFVAAARKEADGHTSPPPPPSVTNLEAGWRERISRDLADLADAWQVPEAWQGTTYAGGIEMPGEIVGLVAIDELVVHGWDIAVATGQPFEPPAPRDRSGDVVRDGVRCAT